MAKVKQILKKVGIATALVVVTLAIGYVVVTQSNVLKYETKVEVIKIKEVDTSIEKIEEIKKQLVEELALDCEVRGIPEGSRNGTTVMDSNSQYSRGMWQFQTRTVQHYYEILYNKTISNDEAILIAHTEDKARSLAYDIIWKEVGGIWNWKNCADKLGLAQKIEIVRELEAK